MSRGAAIVVGTVLAAAIVLSAAPSPAQMAAPLARFVPLNDDVDCVPAAKMSRSEIRRYRRFNVLPRLYGRWNATGCFPRRVRENFLVREPTATGLVVSVNGRDALVAEPEPVWLNACDGGPTARLAPATGADLRALLDRVARVPALREVDVLEIGIARAYTSKGATLHALRIGTLERSIQLRCYDRVEPMLEQAARIFSDDRENVKQLYDFLTIERSSEAVGIDAVATPR